MTRVSTYFALLALALPHALADTWTRIPDAAPPGYEQWESEIVLPAKNVTGDGGWGPAVQRARAFVAKLTLEEKINVTTGTDVYNRCVGQTGTIPRFGWKGLCLEDSPLGVRFADYVSAFPASINVAATWDRSLIYARGKAMGQEHRGKGVNVQLGPMTNLGRVAAGGRNWEGFGADPFLSGVGTVETVNGIQSTGVMANAKHYIGNEQEHFRGGSEAAKIQSSNIDDRTLHELYLWPFAEAVRAGVATVMCAYNRINQTQACESSKLLNGVLKEELDFQGPIMSDWAAALNGIQPALAGMDMNMPGFRAYGQGAQDEGNPVTATNGWWGANLIADVRNGSVPEWRVDDMAVRILAAWYKLGQDQDFPDVNFSQLTQDTYLNGELVNEHVNVQADHYKLIRQIGQASSVLLKNTKGALPLNANKIKRLGIFGSDAGPSPDGPNGCNDRGCDQGTLAMGWGSGTANFPYLIDPYSAIQNYVHTQQPTTVIEAVLNDYNYAQVGAVARQADTCLVFINADSGEGYITVDGNAGDRTNLTLWHAGEKLINAAASQCSNTIVTMHTVGPVLVESWIDNPNITAVIAAGLPGQESGNAITDILFGAVSPSGKLPYTVARQRSDYNADVVYTSDMTTPQITYEEKLEIDYRHFDANNIAPRFEFGFGLSYTTFSYSGLSVRSSNWKRQAPSSVATATATGNSTASSSASVAPPTSGASSSASATATATGTASGSATSSTITGSATSSTLSGSGVSSSLSGSASHSGSSTASGNATATASAPPVISSPIETSPGGPASLYEQIATVTFTVRNAGGYDGAEVSQVYLGFPAAAGEPPKVLRGFEKTSLRRGQAQTVSVPLRRKDVSIWDVVKQKWVVPSGSFKVYVGSSSRDIRLTGSFTPSH